MNLASQFFVDVLNILPDNIKCFFQAPSLENETIQGMMTQSEYVYFNLIIVNEVNKNIFIKEILAHPIVDYINSIEIRLNNKLLFEGYDGLEYGTFSNSVIIPQWFTDKYASEEMYMISNEW